MTLMLRYDPEKRPTAAQMLQHPYFKVGQGIPHNIGAFLSTDAKTKLPAHTQDRKTASTKNARVVDEFEGGQNAAVTTVKSVRKSQYKPGNRIRLKKRRW
jgi:hypothetical protein